MPPAAPAACGKSRDPGWSAPFVHATAPAADKQPNEALEVISNAALQSRDALNELCLRIAKRIRAALLGLGLARRRIAVVGNGPVDPEDAAPIDEHDTVVRFNSCCNYGTSGRKTDVLVLCNTGGAGKHLVFTEGAIDPLALVSAQAIWFTMSPEALAAEAARSNWPPELGLDVEFSRDLIDRHVGARPYRFFGDDVGELTRAALEAFEPDRSKVASTGIRTLVYIRQQLPRSQVTLYGFSHQGWEGHPWEAERALVDSWHPAVRRARRSLR